jgi:hypothetical protein
MENYVPHSLFSLLNRHISFWGFFIAVWPKRWWAQHETSCTLSKNHDPWTNKPRTTIRLKKLNLVLLQLKDRKREENVTLRWLAGLNGTGDNTLWKLESKHGHLNTEFKNVILHYLSWNVWLKKLLIYVLDRIRSQVSVAIPKTLSHHTNKKKKTRHAPRWTWTTNLSVNIRTR